MSLPRNAKRIIEHYTKLNIGGTYVVAPYFMNDKGRKGRRVSVGKGTPHALERETVRLAKKYNFDTTQASAQQIRDFMISHRLGIDCSGLVSWALNELVLTHTGRPLWYYITFKGHPFRVSIVKRFRPVENISARLLTDQSNTLIVHDMAHVRPGDIIRSLNGNHVLVVTEVSHDTQGVPLYFKYVNSTEYAGVKWGIREGKIIIKEPAGHILQQEWIDSENGVNWAYKAASDFPEDTRIVRLNVLADKS